jgi:hypothetical protein
MRSGKTFLKEAGVLLTILMLLMLILPVSATPAQQNLTITIPSGFGIGIKAIIKNVGTATEYSIHWTISAAGGWIIFPPTTKSGMIASIAPGVSVTIKAIFIGFGFNSVTYTVTATNANPSSVTASQKNLFIIFTWW